MNSMIKENGVTFKELEKNIYAWVCQIGREFTKEFLERYDRMLMEDRDKKKYRNKGARQTTVKTVYGEVTYQRMVYEVIEEDGTKRFVYLLDETLELDHVGLISTNMAELLVKGITELSYRECATKVSEMTGQTISAMGVWNVIQALGEKVYNEEATLTEEYKKGHVKGEKEVPVLFEEADGLWINLQGKDRKERLEKNKKKCEKENKEFNPKQKVKTELKLHVMYEGWKKDDKRHPLINKQYIAGMMKPKEIKKLRDARVYQQYDVEKIKLRIINGDGAKWTKGITAKGGIYQKDQFHIMQEIVRDVPKEYRNIIEELVKTKQYDKIEKAIEGLKVELGGEYKAVKKLNTLQSYLSSGLERYQDIVEVPEAPEGVEYRNMGTQESQIFSKLKKRFCSGRKAFSEHGANALAKICVLSEKFSLEELETPIPIDTSVEDWIKEIEENVRKNRTRKDSFVATEKTKEGDGIQKGHIENNFINKILKCRDISELRLSY